LVKEKQVGAFSDRVQSSLESAGIGFSDCSELVAECLSFKDKDEIELCRKASALSVALLKKHFLPEMESAFSRSRKISHAKLADSAEKAVADVAKLGVKNVQADSIESCYQPIIQSGGAYDLKPSAQSDDTTLHPGTVVVRMGARYKSYCSDVGRTYLIDPTADQQAAYTALTQGYEAALGALRVGAELRSVHDAVVAAVTAADPALVPHLTKTMGFATGLEYRDREYVIGPKATRKVEASMTFVLSVGLLNLERKTAPSDDARAKVYSLHFEDTVLVGPTPDVAAEVITSGASRALKHVTYNFEGDEDENKAGAEEGGGGEGAGRKGVKRDRDADDAAGAGSTRVLTDKLRGEQVPEDLRKRHQAELAEQKLREAKARYGAGRGGGGGGGGGDDDGEDGPEAKRARKEIMSYKSAREFPRETPPDRISIDPKRETVLFPVNGQIVPYHISTVKRVLKVDEGGFSYLRVTFVTPEVGGVGRGAAAANVPGDPTRDVYIKELSYRSQDGTEMVKLHKQIADLQKKHKSKESEKKEIAKAPVQQPIEILAGKNPKLTNVYIRPFSGRKATGAIECHKNGLRFTPNKQTAGVSHVDILFSNIKHAFFQPADNEAIVLIHFHLHHPIMIGKKSSKDVQVYTEVMEASYKIDKGNNRNNGFDYDEIEEEQREREIRQKLNEQFQGFVKRVESAFEKNGLTDFTFDIPYRELGFHGVPFKTMSFVMPSVNCLVELTENPFFVITLSEIEVVSLERVVHGLANFDMVFIFKDFDKTPVAVNTIPMESLEPVKQWLDNCDLKYYEGRVNLTWPKIMQTIRADIPGFYEDGGWVFLDLEASDSQAGSDEEESDESEFVPSESDDGEDEDSYSDYGYSDLYSENEYEEEDYGDEDLSSEGKDWSDLEKDAEKEDREKAKRGGVFEEEKHQIKKKKH
jgi:nucleosome binding factor SPN SPT16 subunit